MSKDIDALIKVGKETEWMMSERTQEQWIQEKAEELCVDAGYPINMAELFIPDASKVFVNMMLEESKDETE